VTIGVDSAREKELIRRPNDQEIEKYDPKIKKLIKRIKESKIDYFFVFVVYVWLLTSFLRSCDHGIPEFLK
jgi:hypothetical protein